MCVLYIFMYNRSTGRSWPRFITAICKLLYQFCDTLYMTYYLMCSGCYKVVLQCGHASTFCLLHIYWWDLGIVAFMVACVSFDKEYEVSAVWKVDCEAKYTIYIYVHAFYRVWAELLEWCIWYNYRWVQIISDTDQLIGCLHFSHTQCDKHNSFLYIVCVGGGWAPKSAVTKMATLS